MFENTLSIIAAPKGTKAALEKGGTLNAVGIAQAMRRELGKNVVPALRRYRQTVNERSAAMERERAAMAKPKIDATGVRAAMLRQETRSYLRSLNDGERLKVLTDKPDRRERSRTKRQVHTFAQRPWRRGDLTHRSSRRRPFKSCRMVAALPWVSIGNPPVPGDLVDKNPKVHGLQGALFALYHRP